jgi:hypothetical protein
MRSWIPTAALAPLAAASALVAAPLGPDQMHTLHARRAEQRKLGEVLPHGTRRSSLPRCVCLPSPSRPRRWSRTPLHGALVGFFLTGHAGLVSLVVQLLVLVSLRHRDLVVGRPPPPRGAPVAIRRVATGCPTRHVVVMRLRRVHRCPDLIQIRATVPPWTRWPLRCSLHGGTHLLPCTARSHPTYFFLWGLTIFGFASGASYLHRGSHSRSHAHAHPSPRRAACSGFFVAFDQTMDPILHDCVELHPEARCHVLGPLVVPYAVIASLAIEPLLSPSPPSSSVRVPPWLSPRTPWLHHPLHLPPIGWSTPEPPSTPFPPLARYSTPIHHTPHILPISLSATVPPSWSPQSVHRFFRDHSTLTTSLSLPV